MDGSYAEESSPSEDIDQSDRLDRPDRPDIVDESAVTAAATITEDTFVAEDAAPINTIQSSVQIAPTGDTNPLGDEYNPMLFIQLGDRVVIDSKKYGRTIGSVYYRSLERISIKPDGVSNSLHDFELEQTDDEELYKEEDGVTAAYVIEKRMFDSFVEQQDFRINQIIDTFNAAGELYKSYKIVKVDKDNDYIQIQDLDDTDIIQDLNFNFIGIESDEDFKIISIRQLVGTDAAAADGFKAESNTEEVQQEGQEGCGARPQGHQQGTC